MKTKEVVVEEVVDEKLEVEEVEVEGVMLMAEEKRKEVLVGEKEEEAFQDVLKWADLVASSEVSPFLLSIY